MSYNQRYILKLLCSEDARPEHLRGDAWDAWMRELDYFVQNGVRIDDTSAAAEDPNQKYQQYVYISTRSRCLIETFITEPSTCSSTRSKVSSTQWGKRRDGTTPCLWAVQCRRKAVRS
jgi:hypothetical protein